MSFLSTDQERKDILNHYNRVMVPLDQELNEKNISPSSINTTTSPSRVRVARVDDKIFVEPSNKGKKKLTKKIFKFIPLRQWTWSSWVLTSVFVLGVLRLIFMDHGIINYHQKQLRLNEHSDLIEQLVVENKELVKEIKRANDDVKYQKNLAREQLGVISPEEYLILFAPKQQAPSN